MKRLGKIFCGLGALIVIPMTWVACQTTRGGYESPDYEVIDSQSAGYELRRYPAMEVVATKSADGSGRDGSFMRLFRYIDRGNDEEKKIAMTTPVFMADGKMHFVVPTTVAAEGTPAPTDGAVVVEAIPGGTFAAMRFADREEAGSSAQTLTKLVSESGRSISGDPMFAYYDPPWTPKMLRRNEVLIRVEGSE